MQATPFSHLIVDNFWSNEELELCASEFPNLNDARWRSYPSVKEFGKLAIDNPMHWGKNVQQFMTRCHSSTMLTAFENLTGFKNLSADSVGGGMHMTGKNGRLDMHVDFNVHPDGQRIRRLNVLTFLSRDWDPSWGGVLYLGKNKEIKIIPAWNRMVIFTCSDISWHGHPEPIVDDHLRKSLACYYYTPKENDVAPHDTTWLTP